MSIEIESKFDALGTPLFIGDKVAVVISITNLLSAATVIAFTKQMVVVSHGYNTRYHRYAKNVIKTYEQN